MKLLKWLDAHLEETLLVTLLAVIACVELLQVIARNIPGLPALTWAEEFCRYCWVWSVFLSLPYTIRNGSMLRVSLLRELLPENRRGRMDTLAELITALCMLGLGIHAVSVVLRIYRSGETSAAMTWPMWAVYAVLLPGFFGGFLRAVQRLCLRVKVSGKGGER